MSYVNADALVDTAWVADHLDDANVRIVDATWHLPPTGRNGAAEYQEAHIPGAVYFDIDKIADTNSALPHMLPSEADFAAAVSALGIKNTDRVVVYDANGLFSAPRAWWMFRVFGHDNVALMTGGIAQWKADSRPVTAEVPAPTPTRFEAAFRPHLVRSIDQIRQNIEAADDIVLDARAADRFDGSQAEFRPGVEPGHIPGSANLPFGQITNAEAGTYQDADSIIKALDAVGADGSKAVATTCGSGVSACIVGLGMHLVGRENWAVYDGSWTEWGGRDDTPKAKGAK